MSEAANPAGDDPEAYGRLALTVDVVLIGLRGTRPAALLLRRSEPPQVGLWSLPGGFVRIDETIDAAAGRVLREKAGLTGLHLEQLYTFGALDRDPRMRIVSVAYLALLPERFTLRQLQDVHEAILGTPLNKPAFRRRMLDRGWLEPTGEREAGTSFRPPELYRFRNTR